jgi:hypothetical protein
MRRRDIGPKTDIGRAVDKLPLDLAGASVGATIGLREAQKWRGRYACGVIVKGAAIRAEGEALRRVELAGVVTTSANCVNNYDSLGYGACRPLTHL